MILIISIRFTTSIRLRHVDALGTASLTFPLLESMMTFNFKKHWKATTALCVASTIAVVATTAAFAQEKGPLSNWDLRLVLKLLAKLEKNSNGNGNGNSNAGSGAKDPGDNLKTASPIKHVIVLIGEHRGLDHTFGASQPKGKGETISNLPSKGIVNIDGTPGPNFGLSQQYSVGTQSSYYISATKGQKTP